MDDLLSVREAAQLLGVGVSSVKRWADAGLLPCVKTPGRHRRFLRSEIEALLRKRGGQYGGPPPADHELVDLLLADEATSALVDRALAAARARAGSWGRAADALAPTLEELGARWARGAITIVQEHAASDRLARGLARVADALPTRAGAPDALLVVAEGEEHTLGLSLCEVVLREAGWNVRWGGRRTPIDEVRVFLDGHPLGLLAVSASVVSSDAAQLSRQADAFARLCRAARVSLVFGGRGAWPDPIPFGVRMHRFEELARHVARKEKS